MPYENEELAYWMPDDELNALSHSVIGAAIEAHRQLGPGFDEASYQAALELEMHLRNISHQREVWFDIVYKGSVVGRRRLDFLVGGRLVVEIKVVPITDLEKAQVLSYLKLSGHSLGLVINFNTLMLKDGIRRVIRA